MFDKESSEKLIHDVYHEYSRLIYSYNYIHLKNKSDAEEITNDTFIVAFKKYHIFKDVTNKKAWLFTVNKINIKHYYDRIVKRKIQTIPLNEDIIEQAYEVEFYKDNFDSFRDFLKDSEIDMLTYKYVIGYSNDQIAKILKISLSNCATRLSRIKEKVKKNYFNL